VKLSGKIPRPIRFKLKKQGNRGTDLLGGFVAKAEEWRFLGKEELTFLGWNQTMTRLLSVP
jgi:hypothetical protein